MSSPPKVIGKILSLGFPVPGVQVDNYTFFSAPSFFDYDALIVDVRAAGTLIESIIAGSQEVTTFSGQQVTLDARTSGEVALSDLIARRRDETQALLDRGGVVVAFAHVERQYAVAEGARIGDYDWLPLPPTITLAPPQMVAGEGSQAAVVDWQHPMAAFVATQLANTAYRAHFSTNADDGTSLFARSIGGAAIGVELPLPSGRLFLVPALKNTPTGDARYAMSDALQQGIRAALGATAAGRPPSWIKPDSLPGLPALDDAVASAQSAADSAASTLTAAQSARDDLAKYQRLLWQEGSVGLTPVVIDALKLIGFSVYDRLPGELEIRLGDAARALVEIEGSDRPVDMTPHHRLRQRIERAIERAPTTTSAAPRGILFVNGERLLAPVQRKHITDALRLASETMRYCVAPTSTLYDAVAAKLNGDDDAVSAYRNRLMACDGLLS